MDLDISVTREAGLCIVSPDGEVDVYTAPKLKETLARAIEDGCDRIIIDLDGVEFMDSSGLGALVSGLRSVKEKNGFMVVTNPREAILKVLKITGLDKSFPIYGSLEEARAQLL